METFGSRVRWAREQRGLTQAALAKATCVLTGAIGALEDGLRERPRDLSSLAAALRARPDWLATGQGDWKEAPPGAGAGQATAAAGGAAVPAPAAGLGDTIVQLGSQLSALSPLARASIAPLIAKLAENPELAAEAARLADAIARS